MTYEDQSDLELVPELIGLARPEADAYLAMHRCAEREDGRIPRKYRELVSIAVALTTQCAYCIDTHVKKARAAGCSSEELAEVVFLAGNVRAGASVAHGLLALKLFKEER